MSAARRVAMGMACVAIVAGLAAGSADAQRIDPRRPSVFVVGPPGGASPTVRGDARRTGRARDALPSGLLHVAWRKTIGLTIEQPALVSADGILAIVTAPRGDVIFLDADHKELGRIGVRVEPAKFMKVLRPAADVIRAARETARAP